MSYGIPWRRSIRKEPCVASRSIHKMDSQSSNVPIAGLAFLKTFATKCLIRSLQHRENGTGLGLSVAGGRDRAGAQSGGSK